MVDMVILVFIGFLYPPLAWKVFLCSQKSSPKDFLSVVVVYAFFFSVQGAARRGAEFDFSSLSGSSDH